MSRHLVILNPVAGRGRVRREWPRMAHALRADDGELDLLIADGVGRLEILSLVPRIIRGTHAGDPRLRLERAKRVVIESDTPMLVEADGEIAFEDARRLEIEILPGALQVLA